MHKFSFTVDIVTDSQFGIDTDSVRGKILTAVDGVGTIAAVHPVDVSELKEQGFKVWRARVAGIREPKKSKATKPKVEATVTA